MVAARPRGRVHGGRSDLGGTVAGAGPGVRRGAGRAAVPGRRADRHLAVPRRILHRRDPKERATALDDNRAAVDEAAALGTGTLVLVSGGLPEGDRDIAAARRRVAEAVAELAPYAAERAVRLALEPLHPMYASDRCVVSTLGQALDIAEQFPAEQVGVVVDTYHLWWDDLAPAHIARAGAGGRIACFQVADWVTPLPEGVLLGRGQLGDGCVDLRGLRQTTDAAGYRGAVEVEIFNPALWARDGGELLAEIIDRYRLHVA